MPSISYTVSSGIVSGGSLSVIVDYTVSSTNTQTTFTFGTPAIKWTKPASVALQWKFTFVGGNTATEGADYTLTGTVFPAAGTSGQTTSTPNGLTITWNRKTSDWIIPLKLEILEGTGSGSSYTYSSRGSKTTNLTVPAIPAYDVIYNANGHGTAPANQKKYYGSTLTLAPAMAATGWTFVRWNTRADDGGTGYNAEANYTDNAPLTLYAIWKRSISGVSIGSATVIRVEDDTSTEEADEGTYAYISVPYTVTGAAAANIEMSVTATAETGDPPTVTLVSWQASKPEDTSQNGTFIARASTCDLDIRYSFEITVSANNISVSQAAVYANRTVVLPTAFFLVDFKAGGKGVHFGGAATLDGFFVSMPATFYKAVKMMDGLTFDNVTNAIYYKGAYASYPMIKFKDGADGYGNGIVIGGGGLVCVGGGESADAVAASITSGGSEQLILSNDGAIDIYTECQNGVASATHTTISGKTFSGRAICLKDQTTDNDVYLSYGAAGLGWGDITWLAAWNGYSLRAINKSQISPINIGAVSRTGDTMSGALTVSYATPNIIAKATNINVSLSNNNVSSTVWWGFPCRDTGNRTPAQFLGQAGKDGSTGVGMWVYNFNTSGSQVSGAGFVMYMNKSGTVTYGVPNPANFRSAIGCAPSGYLKGWTSLGSTTGTTAKAITASSYTELLVVMAYSTSYRGSCFIPVAALSTTANEWYCGGGGAGGSSTSGRRAVFKATTTAITPVLITIDGTNYTSTAVVTYIYGR